MSRSYDGAVWAEVLFDGGAGRLLVYLCERAWSRSHSKRVFRCFVAQIRPEWCQEGGTLEKVADRHQWAIDQGRNTTPPFIQQAVLVYVAFRVGSDNRCWWPLDDIAEQTRMHKNTVSKCLRWWTKQGVLKSTAQLRGPTIYELVQYHSQVI